MTSPLKILPEAGEPGVTLETITPSGKLSIDGLSLSISATFNPRGSFDLLDFAGINESLSVGNSPRTKLIDISSPSLITLALASVSGRN